MKNKHYIFLLVLAFIIVLIGVFMKIWHYNFGFLSGNFLLMLGLGIKVGVGLLLMIKVVRNKENDWLNK